MKPISSRVERDDLFDPSLPSESRNDPARRDVEDLEESAADRRLFSPPAPVAPTSLAARLDDPEVEAVEEVAALPSL